MNQNDYFSVLEFRISSEFGGMASKELRRIWCDGIVPGTLGVVDGRPCMTGEAWLAFGTPRDRKRKWHEEEWDYVLLLPPETRRLDLVDWSKLMPPHDVTGWLSLDFRKRMMTIEPLAAYPDRPAVAE